MSFSAHATARYDGALPDDLMAHCAAHVREADLPVEETGAELTVALPRARVVLARDAAGLSVTLDAADRGALHQIRDYLVYLFDHLTPGAAQAMVWQGQFARNAAPPNFHIATLRAVHRVAPRFLRVELDCPGTRRLAQGPGMHFTLLLPPAGRDPVWPVTDETGRTLWPRGQDSLHRAAYTFVDLDAEAGRFTFDLFEHEGGRATQWARGAAPGDPVGLTGPGSGDFPPGDQVLIAGDETALPAIRRILQHSPASRRGDVLVEVADESDIQDLPRSAGLSLTWVLRQRGETLWDHLQHRPAPPGPDRFVWVAAEQALVRQAKARFRSDLGLRADEGYFAYYWVR